MKIETTPVYSCLIIAIILLAIACSKNSGTPSEPNQYGGKDLNNQLSQQEKTLIGTWYFVHEVFNLKNGSDSISTKTLIDYGSINETDTLHFFSTQFVGHAGYCPLVAPDSLKNIVKTCNSFTEYLESCFSDYISGWFIRDNVLVNYTGLYGPGVPTVMDYRPIVTLNNDSLVFVYPDMVEDSLKTYTQRKPVFYKQ